MLGTRYLILEARYKKQPYLISEFSELSVAKNCLICLKMFKNAKNCANPSTPAQDEERKTANPVILSAYNEKTKPIAGLWLESLNSKPRILNRGKIMKNKANFRKAKIGVNHFFTKDYVNRPAWRIEKNKPNQSQFSCPYPSGRR